MASTKHHIYIVDDDADDRENIRDAFLHNMHNDHYVLMEKADELVDRLGRSTPLPTLILLDLNMPGKDGRQVLKEIKSDAKLQHIPVVVLTTSSSDRDRIMAYQLGANCFVTKPDSFQKFVTITDSIAQLWLRNS